jgi:hypothetical protein
MTGGIMPKLFAVRWPIGVFVAVSLIAGTIGFATTLSGRPANDIVPGDDYAGERQQLLFFKAAVGRIDEELHHRGAAATPSLRGEREAVLRRMWEVAGRVPPERLPPDVAALLPPGTPVATAEARPRTRQPVAAPAAKIEIRELQTGLVARAADIDFSDLTLDRPLPLPVYVERPARRTEHARDGEGSEKRAERPVRERPAKDKERAAAEKSAKEQPPADRAKERAAAARAVDRPPVTVERTAVADQSERRLPAR